MFLYLHGRVMTGARTRVVYAPPAALVEAERPQRRHGGQADGAVILRASASGKWEVRPGGTAPRARASAHLPEHVFGRGSHEEQQTHDTARGAERDVRLRGGALVLLRARDGRERVRPR